MHDLPDMAEFGPYSLGHQDKSRVFDAGLSDLTRHHYDKCHEYRRVLDALRFDPAHDHPTSDIPFLPVRMFKEFDLKSIGETDVFKTMTSSGTTGQRVSRIHLDREGATAQTKTLTRIVGDFIGTKRLPMLIIDTASTVRDRRSFSARGAGILGFSMFGRDVTYALDDELKLDVAAVEAFCERHAGVQVLLFGFTYIVYQSLIEELERLGRRIPLDEGVLIHGGGWKKMQDRGIDNDIFKARLHACTGVARVHNYYGMVEQTGSIFMECEAGRLHSSIYSDILVRQPDFSLCERGERGLLELVSLLPRSYPGHVLITEDIGTWLGEDDCPCGRLGRYYQIHGRAEKAEIRGCSDTLASN